MKTNAIYRNGAESSGLSARKNKNITAVGFTLKGALSE